MTDQRPQQSDPHVLDQPWRLWSTIAVMGIVLVEILLGVIVIPVVQGRSAGIDAYTAICRALGILPGSPAVPQFSDRTPPTPVSQVVWTPDVLQILARADVAKGKAKVLEVCIACHGENGVSIAPEYPHLAGQSGAAIYKQLHDYRTGSRVNPQMTDIAKALDEAVIADVAAYYAGQPQRNLNPVTLAGLHLRSFNSWSLVTLTATYRPVRPVTGPAPGARSKRPFSPSNAMSISFSSSSSMHRDSVAMTSMAACG